MLPPGLTVDSVSKWYDKRALKAEGTALAYRANLRTYWTYSLQPQGHTTIDEWVATVREQQRSDDIETRRKWAVELEAFINDYVSNKTGRPLVERAKNVFIASVMSYLKHCLGDRLESYQFTLGTKAERLTELRRKESVNPVTLDEIKRLYTETKNRRDAAIISTLLSGGCGVAEWIQFTNEWHRYANDIRNGKVPIAVNVTRPKTEQSYTHFLWDDAVEDLQELLAERERELGRQLTANDPLFANQYEQPIQDHDVQKTVRRLAHRSGVELREPDKVSYRVRPHEIGKDFFRTQLAIARVDNDVAEYLTGHVVDANSYNKFHRTPEGKAIIEKEASKLRPLVNIRTGKGQPVSEAESELELLARYAKLFLPKAYDQFKQQFPNIRAADAQEAIKYLKELVQPHSRIDIPPTKRWSNHEYDYIKAAVESDDYDQALADGYDLFSTNGTNVHVLRRKKAQA